MRLSVQFDPFDPADRRRAVDVVGAVEAALGTRTSNITPEALAGPETDELVRDESVADESLRSVLQTVIEPPRATAVGDQRRSFLLAVARAGEFITRDELPRGQGLGGLRSSVEQTWKSAGGLEFDTALIKRTGNRFSMYAAARPLIVELLS